MSASAVGIEMALSILIFWLAGYWADSELGTGPWLMLAGVIVGVFTGFRALIRTSRIAWVRSDTPINDSEEK
jgi:F0F1-type ATP synthase assembly protein I